jgi:hypothetical protein
MMSLVFQWIAKADPVVASVSGGIGSAAIVGLTVVRRRSWSAAGVPWRRLASLIGSGFEATCPTLPMGKARFPTSAVTVSRLRGTRRNAASTLLDEESYGVVVVVNCVRV